MIGIRLDTVKKSFIDVKRIKNSADKAARRVHTKYGSFVRQRAKHSIRKRKGSSAPGHPPHSHLGLIRDYILFAASEENVVIGPMLLRKPSRTALEALEHGGQTLIMQHGKPKSITIAAHPFMRPAHEEELKRAPKLWQNSMR